MRVSWYLMVAGALVASLPAVTSATVRDDVLPLPDVALPPVTPEAAANSAIVTSQPTLQLPYAPSPSGLALDPAKLKLASAKALVLDAVSGDLIYAKNADTVTPIASITKLMTAMVVLDAKQPLDETISVGSGDVDLIRNSHSKLRVGTTLSRREMLRLALMSSENRAASALGRHHPGGSIAFITAMNAKARSLGMANTHFVDPTGLSEGNVSTAQDLARMVQAADQYELIREYTTGDKHSIALNAKRRPVAFNNTNALVRNDGWNIRVSKTGFIREAGRCLVMLAHIANRPVTIVLLDSFGTATRVADAKRIKYWLETGKSLPVKKYKKAKRAKKGKVVKAKKRSSSKATGAKKKKRKQRKS